MKLVYEFDEKEILEKVKESGSYDLQRSIVDEIKLRAKNEFVNQVERELKAQNSYSLSEYFKTEVQDEILKKVDISIEKLFENKLTDRTLESKVERVIDNKLEEWITKKIYKRLEAIKADIQFYSTEESNAEAEADQDSHNNEEYPI